MLVKFEWSKNSSVSLEELLNSIKKDTSNNRIFKQLYFGFMPADEHDILDFLSFSKYLETQRAVRHIVIAPEKQLNEYVFYFKILKLMNSWISKSKRWSLRYIWALHYNAEKAHAHILITAYFPEELMISKKDVQEFVEIAKKVFEEKVIEDWMDGGAELELSPY